MRLAIIVSTGLSLPLGLVHGVSARGANCSSHEPAGLTVKTSTGSFTGLIDPEFPAVRQFRAIPFAEPPTGARRWLKPEKLSSSSPTEHRWATKYPPSCPQFFPSEPSLWNDDLTRGNLVYNGAQSDSSGLAGEATSEDCLHLAIWTPAEVPAKGLPVLFFMTGGGFALGGVDLPWQIPTSWVQRSASHIVVSINYRLNILGFPNARGLHLEEQNLGILDQRVALEWVRDNIAAFGGDPDRIMQWGRSAGGTSADIHAYAFREDPIAESYFFESGTALGGEAPPRDLTFSAFSAVAHGVGCGQPCGPGTECASDEEHGRAELDCMRQVSQIQITNFIGNRPQNETLAFGVIPDDKIVFSYARYIELSEEGNLAKVPTLISFTANEASSLVDWPSDPAAGGPDQDLLNYANLWYATCAALNSTAYRNRLGADVPVFRFQYAAEFPNLNVYDWLGAYHNSETTLIFGTYGLLDHVAPSTAYQDEVSRSMQDHILAFARDPYNGPQRDLDWLPTNVTEPNFGTLIRFGGSDGDVVKRVSNIEVDGVCLGLRDPDPFPK